MQSSTPLSGKVSLFSGKQAKFGASSIFDSLGFRVGFGYAFDMKAYGDRVLSGLNGSKFYKGIQDQRMFVNLGTGYILGNSHRFDFELERSFLVN